MNPDDYCSREAAQRLKKARIALKSAEAFWVYTENTFITNPDGSSPKVWKLISTDTKEYKNAKWQEPDMFIPAHSMAEVWRELPEGFAYDGQRAYLSVNKSRKNDGTTYASYYLPGDKAVCGSKKHNTNSTDALIDLWIWTKQRKEK